MKYFLWIFFLLPFTSSAQQLSKEETRAQMARLGYEQVDLQQLRTEQKSKPCSTCPHKKAAAKVTSNNASIKANAQAEIEHLQQQLVDLRKKRKDLGATNPYSAMMQKYKKAIADTEKRIKDLQLNSSN